MSASSSENYVGAYRILRLINRGGQGSVYLGYDERLQRRVAIKIYDLPDSRPARKDLLREAQLVASVESPKVVAVYDVIESGAHLALVMEYVPGCNLEEFLQKARPSLSSIVILGTDIAGALAVARQQRIVHGDVKASNVLITADGHAKLTDFGIAREEVQDLQRGALFNSGSLSALAPEQCSGEAIDGQVDIFALGILLYRMLCGEHPFFHNGQFDLDRLLHRAPLPLEERIPADQELPEALGQLLDTMLDKDPRRRPNNTRGIRQVLREVSRGIPMSAGNSLLREARPFFRLESTDDIPLQIPRDLSQFGRSRKSRPEGIFGQVHYWFTGLRRATRITLFALAGAGVMFAVFAAVQARVVPIKINAVNTNVVNSTQLPVELSRTWLAQEVSHALNSKFGEVRLVGDSAGAPHGSLISAGTLRRSPGVLEVPVVPEQVFDIDLRCADAFCVLIIAREHRGERYSRQAVLFPDMSIEQWRDSVHTTTLGLFH